MLSSLYSNTMSLYIATLFLKRREEEMSSSLYCNTMSRYIATLFFKRREEDMSSSLYCNTMLLYPCGHSPDLIHYLPGYNSLWICFLRISF